MLLLVKRVKRSNTILGELRASSCPTSCLVSGSVPNAYSQGLRRPARVRHDVGRIVRVVSVARRALLRRRSG